MAPDIRPAADPWRAQRTIFQTKLFWAPMARMVPISAVRSVTEMTKVFMMIITATTAMTATIPLKMFLMP